MLILAAVIFALVAVLVIYGIVRYRARDGAALPTQIFGSRKAEITWTVIPIVIVTVLFVFTVRTMAFVDAPREPADQPDVTITGHQWWWEARYANGAVAVQEIHIPVGRRLLARIEAADVIHDFWVPQLARKMDAVPGRSGYIWLEANAPGTYEGRCSEFCGMQHAWMHFTVIAEPEPQFSAWLQRQAEPPREPEAGLPVVGGRLFREEKCTDCHAVSATDTQPRKGPPLAHIAGRKLLGGDIPNSPANLARWTVNPQSIKPGNRMPNQRLSNADTLALTAYLESLR